MSVEASSPALDATEESRETDAHNIQNPYALLPVVTPRQPTDSDPQAGNGHFPKWSDRELIKEL
eukprot:8314335-Ditylum_brightwellii.AAC.1